MNLISLFARLPTSWCQRLEGAVFGVLLAVGSLELIRGLFPFADDALMPLLGILGAFVAPTRGMRLLRTAAAVAAAGILFIGYGPLAPVLCWRILQSDPVRPAPGVVVLSASVQDDGEMGAEMQARMLKGYEMLRLGQAQHLVITRLDPRRPSAGPAVRAQMELLQLRYPVEEVGLIDNTHEEAVAVAQLARRRGWREVILVTNGWHLRRAAACFQKAGLAVIRVPCVEWRYDTSRLKPISPRLQAFRDWAHEVIGYEIYRLRGWL